MSNGWLQLGVRWVLPPLVAIAGWAGDWPMWRHDAARSAYSSADLPDRLAPQWVRSYSARVQVWDDPLNHDLMPYDRVFEPVVLGQRLFVGFNDRDRLVALSTRTGEGLWEFIADGPIRLPPAAWGDRVFVVADDDFLHCLAAEDGRVLWRFRGGPSARKALGNGRLISAWPARGGPVVREGIVYFAASLWPFLGTFLYALDAKDGGVVWVNDGTGADFIKQPHSAPAFAGVAPQGALVATADVLLVPGGRSVPAAFERATGRLLHFELNAGGKGNGGSFVVAGEQTYFVHTRQRGVREFELATGKKGAFTCNEPVLDGEFLYTAGEDAETGAMVLKAEEAMLAADYAVARAVVDLRTAEASGDPATVVKARAKLTAARGQQAEAARSLTEARALATDAAATRVVRCLNPAREVVWEIPADGSGDLIRAGDRLYAAGADAIRVIQLPDPGGTPVLVDSIPAPGQVMRLLAADDRLFAVTLDGRILAFGADPLTVTEPEEEPVPVPLDPVVRARARALLEAAGEPGGYALCFGADDVAFLDALRVESDLHLIVVDPDSERVRQCRKAFSAAGHYGRRVAVHPGDPLSFGAPPYFAELVVVSPGMAASLRDRTVLEAAYASVRPYGGLLWIAAPLDAVDGRGGMASFAGLPQARVGTVAGGCGVTREGRLPGSADWTHLYGDIANTVKSDDRTVRLPLGVLWFGGSSNMDVLPRHGHGPAEQVVGGRLFVQGIRSMSARDVYTGRMLWKREISDLDTFGIYYDETYTNTPLSTIYNQVHIPGANARGANFVATEETVYLVVGDECRELSARTGEPGRRIRMPAAPAGAAEASAEGLEWGFLGIYEEVLLGGTGFAHYNRRFGTARSAERAPVVDLSASAGLMAFNRRTAEPLWRVEARYGFVHNGIVAGNGRVYCLDRLPRSVEEKLERRGRELPEDYRVLALDARTGEILWEHTESVFGTWLAYAKDGDILLQAGARAPDRLDDEVGQGMAAHRGFDGQLIWYHPEREYSGPCIVHHDTVITTPVSYRPSSGAYDLRTGEPRLIANPVTGEFEPWRIFRTYGCNTPIASEHLLTFRSGAAGFYDLECHSGTGNLGGFRSGCSANLVVANGVLNAPDYTRTCSCAYQNQTSLGLIPMPDVEVWTYNAFGEAFQNQARVRRLGLNLGAPGDRRDGTGTLWMEYPRHSGNEEELPVTLGGAEPVPFRRHVSRVVSAPLPWVAASGIEGIESLEITTRTGKPEAAAGGGADKNRAGPEAVMAEPYTVRLHFIEPGEAEPGERVFRVLLQGREVVPTLDVREQAGGAWRALVKEFRGVAVTEGLSIRFERTPGSRLPPVLCGVELVAESGEGAE